MAAPAVGALTVTKSHLGLMLKPSIRQAQGSHCQTAFALTLRTEAVILDLGKLLVTSALKTSLRHHTSKCNFDLF